MYTLEFDHVSKRYHHDLVVDDLSFDVQPGRVTGFLGPNGAGKSTAMKMLLDLAKPNAGRARIGGRRYRDLDSPARTVGVVLEPNAFHPGRSGRNHLLTLADGLSIAAERVDELLELVGLTHASGRRVGAYSLGMRQRLSLAGALLCDPPVLVLDEPGNGLDPQGIRWLRDLLRARAAAGSTVFVSSHLLAEVEHLADDVVVINRGRLITLGALADLQRAAVTVRSPHTDALRDVLVSAGATVTPAGSQTLMVRGMAAADVGERAFAAGIALHELATEAGSLEDLFLTWTGERPIDLTAQEEAVPV
jgi:ABC-2 type transport system ATP-binding protein